MGVFGITPVEAAFDVIGLTNAKLIMDYFFFDTKWGLLIFSIGFLYSLWVSVERENLKHFYYYILLSFLVWFIFVKPVSPVPATTSTMEVTGSYEKVKANDLVEQYQATDQVNTVLAQTGEMFNSITLGLIKAITVATKKGKYNYLESPFLVHKISLQMQKFAGGGIKDKDLKEKVQNFYYKHYLPVLNFIKKDQNPSVKEIQLWWPGHPDIVKNYSLEAQSEWNDIRGELKEYIESNQWWSGAMKYFNSIVTLRFNQKEAEDQMIISLFNTEKSKSPQFLAMKNPEGVNSHVGQDAFRGMGRFFGNVGVTLGQIGSVSISEGVLRGLPYLEGYASLIMYTFFPVTLLFTLLLRSWTVLFQFFKYLFWVKSWPIVWAVVYYAGLYMAEIQSVLSPEVWWFWEAPHFNVVTSIFLIMSPLVALFMVEGIVQGLGYILTAFTLMVSRFAGMVPGVMTKAAGAAGKFAK